LKPSDGFVTGVREGRLELVSLGDFVNQDERRSRR